MKRPMVILVALPLLCVSIMTIGDGPAAAAQLPDIGLPIYPGAMQDPDNPSMKTPFMQNLHLLSGDPFSKILAWYKEKLGKFTDASSKKGQQALWNDKTPEGRVRTVTISTIGAPEGKVKITLMTGMLRN